MNINIVLLDENFNQWIPTSTFTCVLDFIFYEKYTELSHEKIPNVFQQMYKKYFNRYILKLLSVI